MHIVPSPTGFDEWRDQARTLLRSGTAPDAVIWEDAGPQGTLFQEAPAPYAAKDKAQQQEPIRAPKEFVSIARAVACHRDAERWELLYRILWRLIRSAEPTLLQHSTDPDILRLNQLQKHIRRDVHKMHAFVRFKLVETDASGRESYLAWFEPEHRIVAYTADFFVRRFFGMNWTILSPDESIHWNGKELMVGEGGQIADVPLADEHEDLWRSYYKSTFNPARLKLKAMQSEMPKKYWKNLPESELIESLSRTARDRTEAMLQTQARSPKPPPRSSYLEALHKKNASL